MVASQSLAVIKEVRFSKVNSILHYLERLAQEDDPARAGLIRSQAMIALAALKCLELRRAWTQEENDRLEDKLRTFSWRKRFNDQSQVGTG